MDASGDARKATELDPTYAKAWGRLGTASSKLSRWSQSVDAWKKALDCLPKDESATELDKRLRIQFNESLKEAEEALTAPIRAPVFYEAPKGTEMPWHRAKDWEQKLITANKMSSAFVILRAYEEFTSGVETLKKVEQKVVNGQLMWYGKPTALVDLTNGIMRDRRSFHFDSDWIDTYNKQVIFECEMFQAWTDGGAKKVQAEAPQRLKKQGWQPVRQALSTIIRAWVMSGFMASATGRYLAAFGFFSRAVEVLEWGRQIWNDVSVEHRGVIFELTFVRGVRRLQLSCMHECLAEEVKDCSFNKDDLAGLSRHMAAEVDANPPTPGSQIDPGFLASFWMYPKAEALSTLGWYHMQQGFATEDEKGAKLEFARSSRYYMQCAQSYPEDEENVPYFLYIALEAYWWYGKALREIILLLHQIRDAIPKMKIIWGNSEFSNRRDTKFELGLEFASKCEQALADGTISLNDIIKPETIKTRDRWGGGVIYI